MSLRTLFLWLLTLLPALAERPAWQPEKTWVFAVGILRFDDAGLHGWPEEGRLDAVMLDALRQRGVPADHVLFLKNEQATAAQLTKRFPAFLRRSGPEDTLIFYYAGHGSRDYTDPARPVSLVTYDTKATWSAAMILAAIEGNFRGSRVLLTADCCHSGGLAEEAAKAGARISYGTLTSARASATSTGNWTFTQCLTDLYRGNPLLDLDHDGAITFQEAARYCDLEMAFCENQRVTHAVTGRFPRELIVAPAAGTVPERVGERCEGREEGKWYKAKIIGAKDGKFQVTWPGWDKTHDSWLALAQLRAYEPKTLADGATVEIEWGGKWYPGKVVRSELGLLLVHYDGYTAADHEWVPMARVRAPK